MKNIAVFFGGTSVEHDISIITAMQAFKALKQYKAIPIYIKPDGNFVTGENLTRPQTFLNFDKNVKKLYQVSFEFGKSTITLIKSNKIKSKIKIDCALLCNHGHGGEDGCLQGLLELAFIPYTSCNVLSSALCMDKVLSKIIFKTNNIKSPAYVYMNNCEYKAKKLDFLSKIKDDIKLPCIIKPANLGSSVGIGICEDMTKLEDCIDESFNYDDKILVEKYVENAREFCCAVIKIGDKVFTSKIDEVKKSKIYTFSEKYLTAKEQDNKKLSQTLEKQIKKLAEKTYRALMCDGVVRVDFLLDEKQNVLYVNEVNSIPGSLSFNLFSIPFVDLINSLIDEAIDRFNKKKELVYTFSSQAIEAYIKMTDHMKYKMS